MDGICLIILTYNEEGHIERCIRSASSLVNEFILIDSYSSDRTREIAESLGAIVYQNPWPGSHAQQFNWALKNIPISTKWILRLDADEYLLPELVDEIKNVLPKFEAQITGVYLKRRVYFMDHWIKYGGYYPTKILRLWRNHKGYLEDKLMDEHVKLTEGATITLKNDFVDENLNNLSWWIQKHNGYATREAAEILNVQYGFFKSNHQHIEKQIAGSQEKRKRWFKDGFYSRLPLFVRPLFYFFYRYIFRLGFLDGTKGLIWHFLQGFWYRFLVDAKIYDIKRRSKSEGKPIKQVLEEYLGHSI